MKNTLNGQQGLLKFMLAIIMFSFLALQQCFAGVPAYDNAVYPIHVTKAQQQFAIHLKANPTTGYKWVLQDYNHQLIEMESHHFVKSFSGGLGATGMEIWQFKVKEKFFTDGHSVTLNFLYERPWNHAFGKKMTFTVKPQIR